MAAGKCPGCGKAILRATLHPIDISQPFGSTWKGVTYNCTSCSTVLSVAIDPFALKNDIINGVVKKLREGS